MFLRRALLSGFGIWLGGTIVLRLFGQYLLLPDATARTLVLFAFCFTVLAVAVPALLHVLNVPPAQRWPALTLLLLPTLLLDPFTSLFFDRVFPNLNPGVAGSFGGLMLICCAGAVAGVWRRR